MIAIIPARGGSKRIPRKNIRLFMGRPMLAYAIEAAQASGLFERVMVSTDDDEIARIGQALGAEVPFLRSQHAASDEATTADALCEVIAEYRKIGVAFDALCCIYPCVPLLTADMLQAAGSIFSESGAPILVPVVRYSCPIQRALRQGVDGFLEYREPAYIHTRTQDLEPMYHDAGVFYFYRTHALLAPQPSDRRAMYELPEGWAQDVDNEEDWNLLELKYQLRSQC